MKLGAHVSSSKPFSQAVDRAKTIGCDCFQIFANSPTRWSPVDIDQTEIEKFIELNQQPKLEPIVIHGIYLINLASENHYFYLASIKSLIDDMRKAKKLGALGVNFHLGSTLGRDFSIVLPKIVLAIKDVLAAVAGPDLILENSAGAGNIIGDRFSELGTVIKAVGSDRLKVTLDTAHAFASGYDFKSRSGIDAALLDFDQEIGLNRLVCLHLNDSAVPINSKKDRHADIGKGYIDIAGFKNIVNHPKLKNLPGIIETPSNKGLGDVDNLKILRDLID